MSQSCVGKAAFTDSGSHILVGNDRCYLSGFCYVIYVLAAYLDYGRPANTSGRFDITVTESQRAVFYDFIGCLYIYHIKLLPIFYFMAGSVCNCGTYLNTSYQRYISDKIVFQFERIWFTRENTPSCMGYFLW